MSDPGQDERPSKRQRNNAGVPGPSSELNGAESTSLDTIFQSSQVLNDLDLSSRLSRAFNDRKSLHENIASVSSYPFPLLHLRNVFRDDVLKQVEQQLLAGDRVSYTPNRSDLFSYSGTGDLADPELAPPGSTLASIRDALYSQQFIDFLSRATGIELDTQGRKPDLSSHIYRRGDYLACHDDSIMDEDGENGRRIAYILYLVPKDWSTDDGGNLDLFSIDSNGCPNKVVTSIAPEYGSICLFEATPTSFHAVSQVTIPKSQADSRFRLSISGWFHGPLPCRLALRNFSSRFTPDNDGHGEDALSSLINETYLDETARDSIKQRFVQECSIELKDFLRPEGLKRLLEWTNSETTWKEDPEGPAFLRKYYGVNEAKTEKSRKVIGLFQTQAFRDWLSSVTGLDSESLLTHRVIPRRFRSGCYTLLHDQGHDPIPGLDVILSLGTGDSNVGWEEDWGGGTHYIAKTLSLVGEEKEGEEDSGGNELLAMYPSVNSLQIVMRDSNTHKFVRFVNCSIEDEQEGRSRYDIESVYKIYQEEDETMLEEEEEEEEGGPSASS